MSKHYPRTIVPHAVACRMHPEDVAATYLMRLSVDDVLVTPAGERPLPDGLYLREAHPDRKRRRWYRRRTVDGRVTNESTGCDERDLDGAKAWVLTRMVRAAKNARARLAPETIELAEVFDQYLDLSAARRDRGEIKPCSFDCYVNSLKRLNAHLGDVTLADVYSDGAEIHLAWCLRHGLARNTAVGDNTIMKVAINAVMQAWGSPYRVGFKVGASKPRAKDPYEPWEIDAILATAEDGLRRGPDGKPSTEVDQATGETRILRVSDKALLSFHPFIVAVRFDLDSGTRSEATCQVTYTDPTGPWLDVESGLLNRRGEMTVDVQRKRRGSCLMSASFMAWLWPRAQAAIARGETHLVTDWRGRPIKRLCVRAWRRLQEAAGVRYRCVHTLKDTAVQIARREGVSLNDAAERFRTTPETLMAFYGADWDLANQVDPAEAMGKQARWRATAAAVAARAERAKAARRERPLPPVEARVGGNRGGGRRRKWVDKARPRTATTKGRKLPGRPGWEEIVARAAGRALGKGERG